MWLKYYVELRQGSPINKVYARLNKRTYHHTEEVGDRAGKEIPERLSIWFVKTRKKSSLIFRNLITHAFLPIPLPL